MRFLLRPANLFLALSYLAISAVPFMARLAGRPVERPGQLFGTELMCWIATWAVFARPARFHWLLLPAFVAVPVELYLYTYYGQGISPHHMGIIFETSPAEAMAFLGSKVWLMLAVFVAVVAWWGAGLWAARKSRDLDWNDSSRWVVLVALALAGAVIGYGQVAGVAPPPVAASASASASVKLAGGAPGATSPSATKAVAAFRPSALPPLPNWAKLPIDFTTFVHSWPFGLYERGYDFYKERRYLADLNKSSANFRFHARLAEPDGSPQVVVMVIGESSRYDRWGLNGYERDTNPLLRQEANLVVLPDVITSVAATRLSVPVIISRKPATASLKDGFSEKSFITAFKEAGFKTFWLSNQISFGKFDTPVSVFAKEADVVEFLNLGGYTNNSNYDEVLFSPLKNAVADKAQKKLIVLHTLGSHWNYSHRYPKEFDKWLPSLHGVDKPVYTDLKIKPQLNNSYDSSILYTDWFLSQVIGALKGAQQPSSLLYVADHGQTLYDNSCKIAFHGHNTQFEFHVPAFVWYSDEYRERFPAKVDQL
ncbi:MAG TPA: phosphoethanolamine transferase, partial [Telluria sp.]|nr:phosphoethanolamine transferase [Telluria sp.]